MMELVLIEVVLTNRTATLSVSDPAVRKRLRDFWAFAPKGVWMMPKYRPTRILRSQRAVTVKRLAELQKSPDVNAKRIQSLTQMVAEVDAKLSTMWDGKISLMYGTRVPAGLFRATWRDAEQACGVRFVAVKSRQTIELLDGLPPAAEGFKHQNECVDAMVAAISRGGGIVLAATSSGKTAIAARLFAKTKCVCLFVVDQLDLLYQQRKELEEWLGEPIGIVGDSEFKPERITVATIQTLDIHQKDRTFRSWFDAVDLEVVDELHEQMNRRNFDILKRIKPVAVFGLTATLQLTQKETRMKSYAFAGPVVYRFPIKTGVERGVLAEGYVLQLLFPPLPSSDAIDYRSELALQVTQNETKLSACSLLVRELIAVDRHVVTLVDRVPHLKDVHDVLKDVEHRLAYGHVGIEDRRVAKELFEDENVKLIIANKVFKKGISIKRIDAMLDLAEGKSKNDAVQKYGRGIRLHEHKRELIYIDFGTSGHGRFAKAATSRRRALKAAGISVSVVQVKDEAEALAALRKFMKKVVR